MAYIPKQLAQSNVASTTETTVYTVATGTSCIVKQIIVANVTASAAVTSLSIVASGGTAGVTNRVYEQMSVPANSTVTLDVSQVMAAGGFISVKQGTSSAITTTISGVEFGSAALFKDIAVSRRTSGNITLNSTSWANVDTGLDLTLNASAGDYVEVSVAAFSNSEAVYARLDVVSVVSGSPVNSWGVNTAESASSEGVGGWTMLTGTFTPISGSVGRLLSAADISSGTVTLRLRYRTDTATNKTLQANTNNNLTFMAVNHGVAAPDVIPSTLIDAKGDLIVGSAADTAARLAVGTNNLVLMADSAESTGVKWGAGAWTSYTPTLTQSGDVTKTVTRAKYTQIGKTVHVSVALDVTGSGTASNVITISLPVTASIGANGYDTIGAGRVYDASASAVWRGVVVCINSTTVRIEGASGTSADGLGVAGMTAGLAAGDVVIFSATYEAA